MNEDTHYDNLMDAADVRNAKRDEAIKDRVETILHDLISTEVALDMYIEHGILDGNDEIIARIAVAHCNPFKDYAERVLNMAELGEKLVSMLKDELRPIAEDQIEDEA